MFGKRLYKTSMLNFFRLILLAIVIFFFNDFYLETITTPKFWEMIRSQAFSEKLLTFFRYHYQYPGEFISFFFTVIVPAVYYGFIRGVRFHEKGFIFNRGIPFMDSKIVYADVKTYKLLHPKLAISIHTKAGEAFVIADNTVERVIAILDQHNIPGDLAQDDYVRLFTNIKRILIFVVSFVVLLFVVRKLGLYFSNL